MHFVQKSLVFFGLVASLSAHAVGHEEFITAINAFDCLRVYELRHSPGGRAYLNTGSHREKLTKYVEEYTKTYCEFLEQDTTSKDSLKAHQLRITGSCIHLALASAEPKWAQHEEPSPPDNPAKHSQTRTGSQPRFNS